MGYYSAVGISIKEKDYQKLQDNLKKSIDYDGEPVKQETIKFVQNILKTCYTNLSNGMKILFLKSTILWILSVHLILDITLLELAKKLTISRKK